MKKKNSSKGRRNLREEVIAILQKHHGKSMNHKQIAAELEIRDAGLRTLIHEILVIASEEGIIAQPERGKFLSQQSSKDGLTGIISINRFGKGFVQVEGVEKEIHIDKENTGTALWGDLVKVELQGRGRRKSAVVTEVLQRHKQRHVGVVQIQTKHTFFIPSDSRTHVDFYIPDSELLGARNGDKVIAEITSWTDPKRKPFGKIVKVLGKPGSHSVEMHAIIAEFDLPESFPPSVDAESDAIPDTMDEAEIAKRRDFRTITTFTIDPYDAKDFDDALSLRKVGDNRYEIGVHIADVTHYVRPGTALEAEALQRATSVYLVDRTIPMLPEKLSNNLCSLRPNEDKLCFSVVFEMNDDAQILSTWIGRTVIHSDRRFTYEEAQEIIEGKAGDYQNEVLQLNAMAVKLRKKRFSDGSIDFNTEEVKFRLDDMGKPLGVTIKRMKDSNRLIEEFMLLANQAVGIYGGGTPQGESPRTFVYRVHDKPDHQRLIQLRTFLSHLGYKLPNNAASDPSKFIRSVMRLLDGQPEADILRQMAIRSMAKAEYSVNNIGHFGLGFSHYTHFTSPIRRYPDMMAHRLLQHYLDGGKPPSTGDYDMRCKQSSLMEKRAAEAERASIKYKQVEYMMDHIGEVFEGVVSGLTGWGLYVEIGDTKSEGQVALKSITRDRFEFDADKYIIRGIRYREEIHLGDKVMVKVVAGDLNKRTLDFILV